MHEILINDIYEPIFVSCYNNKRNAGGIYRLHNDELIPIFDEINCHGLFYYKEHNLLFCVTRKMPQIVCFKVLKNNQIQRYDIKFKNYTFGEDAHGICIVEKKLFLIATNGDSDSDKAVNAQGIKTNKVGKIIVSDLEFNTDHLVIKDSKIINPFDCSHHHHINEICFARNNFFMTSFSYCHNNKNFVENGAISSFRLSDYKTELFLDGFVKPHSLSFYNDKLYLVSSADSKIFSINLNDKSICLEYKGPDVFIKGLLVTDQHFYIGMNYSIGRTDSKFVNSVKGILKFNRITGETKKISLPPQSNNVYSIVKSYF